MRKDTVVLTLAVLAVWLSAGVAWAGIKTTSVPEPTSLALLATAIGGVAIAKFRRRK